MIIDLNEKLVNQKTLKYDVLIVGAGTLGLFAASYIKQLSPNMTVALVEAGGRAPTGFDSEIRQIGKPHFGVDNGRAKGLGGTSSLWGGQLAEFDEFDIRRSQAAWGFSYEELISYYDKTYDLLGIKFQSNDRCYHETFINKLGLNMSGVEYYVTNWLRQPNFAFLFRDKIKGQGLHVFVNATASDAKFRSEKCVEIEVLNQMGESFQFAAEKVIFACGTIQTNQFFLSTGNSGHVPWSGNSLVGAYFQDHLAGNLGNITVSNEKLFREIFENGWINGNKVQPKFKLNAEMRDQTQSSVAMSIGYESDVYENLKNVKSTLRGIKSALNFSSARTFLNDIAAIRSLLIPLIRRYIKNQRVMLIYDKKVYLYGQGEQISQRQSMLSIDQSYEGGGKLKPLVLDWRVSGDEVNSFWLSAKAAKKFFLENGIGDIEIDSRLEKKSPKFIDELYDTYHMSGGLVSSADSEHGVVNSHQKVWGTDNVWIFGSATFPSNSHANTTLTALALAIRSIESMII